MRRTCIALCAVALVACSSDDDGSPSGSPDATVADTDGDTRGGGGTDDAGLGDDGGAPDVGIDTPEPIGPDRDGDGVPDELEGTGDPDGDGLDNADDDDSDGDGHSDAEEYGRTPGSGASPIDRDGDGVPDMLDLDSDADGIADADELGCPDSTGRATYDSDGDGISDLVEVTFGSDPCDDASGLDGVVDFYFELPFGDPPQSDLLDFGTDVRDGDIAFNVDTTGSMGGEIDELRATLSTRIIPAAAARLESVGFAVSHFDDFPCGEFGGGNDVPFALLQRVTLDADVAQTAVEALPLHNGGDGPESGLEALYQLATGEGTNDCSPGLVPPFDPLDDYVADAAFGALGGAGFRRGAVPIAVHVTDASSHANGEGGYPYGATRAEAYAALDAAGVRVIGVASGTDARSDLEGIARETGAVVPVCAWDGARGAGCADGQCCTGRDGGGRAPDGAGDCPLVFDIDAGGAGLDDSIVAGIEALVRFSPLEITTQVRPDPEALRDQGIDTACFISRVTPDVALPPAVACATDPVVADTDGDGEDDGFVDVTPGSLLYFRVEAQNDCVEATQVAQTFVAWIDVVAGGAAVLDSRLVTIVIPPEIKR